MEIKKIKDMKGGWFVGDFDPSVLRTPDFEVAYKFHKKDEIWDSHYHKKAIELTYLIKGRMLMNGKELTSGDILVMFPYEVAEPIFLEDCEIIVVKAPSVEGDKYIVQRKIEDNL